MVFTTPPTYFLRNTEHSAFLTWKEERSRFI
jgi:hypothetical protein